MEREDKRGQSQIITTVLIVLLVLVAIVVVWTVVKKTIQEGSNQVDISQFSIELEVESVYIAEDNNSMNISVHRSGGKGDLNSLIFLLYDNNTKIEHKYEYDYPKEVFGHEKLETVTYRILCEEIEPALNCGGMPYRDITKIKIAFTNQPGGSPRLSDEIVDGKGNSGEDDFRELVEIYSVAPTSGCLDKNQGDNCTINDQTGTCDSEKRCLGIELIQNGNFENNLTFWNTTNGGGNWYANISESRCVFTGSSPSAILSQNLNLNLTNKYLLAYEIHSWNGILFSLTPSIAGNLLSTKSIPYNGDESFVAISHERLNINISTPSVNYINIDSISVREIL